MGDLFDVCVAILYWISDVTGLTYKEANIWIFVIIHPLLTIFLFYYVIRLRKQIKNLKIDINKTIYNYEQTTTHTSLSSIIGFGQVWGKTIDYCEILLDAKQTNDNGYIFIGFSDNDYFLVKTNIEWRRRWIRNIETLNPVRKR